MPDAKDKSELRRQGMDALHRGEPQIAINLLGQYLAGSPHDAPAQAMLGIAYSRKGLHPEAIQRLDRAVVLSPLEAGLHYNRGVALQTAGYSPEARAAFQQALALNPNLTQAQQRMEAIDRAAAGPLDFVIGTRPATTAALEFEV
jgi:Flp pilus assembly protein TadD